MKNFKESGIVFFVLSLLVACDVDNEYLKHDLEYEKIGECRNINSKMDITANTIGERYVFQECLDASYNGSYSVNRKGDTVVVQLNNTPGASSSLFRITLDINTRPDYKYLSLNGSVFPVYVKRY
jgi:hypothetical protein